MAPSGKSKGMLYKELDAHFRREIRYIYIWSSVDVFKRLQYRMYAVNELPNLLFKCMICSENRLLHRFVILCRAVQQA
jgi:hypothetical protein